MSKKTAIKTSKQAIKQSKPKTKQALPASKPKTGARMTSKPSMRASGYDGATASRNRYNRAFMTSYAVDEDSQIGAYDAERTRLESRDLFRNGLAKAGVDRFVNFVVSTGFNIQAKSSKKDWNQIAEKWFSNWTKISDYTKRKTWIELLQMIVRDRLLNGETFVVLTANGFLQFIESERICTPEGKELQGKKIVQGIEIVQGLTSAYYVCERNEYGGIDKTKWTRIDAANVLHVSACWRADQIRSQAELHPILNALRDKTEFTNSTLISAKIAAKKSLLITSDNDLPSVLPSRDQSSTSSQSTETLAARTTQINIQDGEITYGAPGDKLEAVKNEHPATTYEMFNRNILAECAAILGISYEILMLELSKTDEVALRVASQVFRVWQQWLSDKFIEKIWTWRIAKAIKAGDLPPAPLDSNGVSEWYKINILPPPDCFVKDQTANDIQSFNLGSNSITAIAKRKSLEAIDILQEKADDIGTAIELAEILNKKYGQVITWRDLINSSANTPSLASSQIESDQAAIQAKPAQEKKDNQDAKKDSKTNE